MDQVKIGKFIADCRKKNNLTQMQLAEILNITDRAVSKWETGKAMPDSSIMLELCSVLKITVNDLLCGEINKVENYNKNVDDTLIEMVKNKENSDKMLLTLEVVIGVLSMLVLMTPIIIGSLIQIEDWKKLLIVFSGVIPAFIGFFFSVKIEQVAGYYKCDQCGYLYVPTYKEVTCAYHLGRTRKLKCPKCGVKTWHKKIINNR